MAIRDIELLGSEALRTPGEEITTFDEGLAALVEDMFETMYHAEGIGLAAPQIGLALRVFVVDVPGEETEEGGDGFRAALVNPEIAALSEETDKAPEGCLSIPGLEGVVERPTSVVMKGFDPAGEPIRVEATGLVARALQHELDHLDGVLFLDRLGPLKRKMLLKKWRKAQEERVTEEEGASL
ncbi:MAG: peptide deformylase [Longimicrobiales bacterium]|nr:peptide deformylase [Longimicrobiales bacterium]